MAPACSDEVAAPEEECGGREGRDDPGKGDPDCDAGRELVLAERVEPVEDAVGQAGERLEAGDGGRSLLQQRIDDQADDQVAGDGDRLRERCARPRRPSWRD
jgi:hypothetical protein